MLVSPSCLTVCNPMDCSPPGSSVPGILQARMLERAARPSSRGSSDPGIEPGSPAFRAASLCLSHQGRPSVGRILRFPLTVDQRPTGLFTGGVARRDLTLEKVSEKALLAPGLTALFFKRAPDTHCLGSE